MLFGLDETIVCTGDSCPSLDYNVANNMLEEIIEMKMMAYPGKVMYIKADTSTSESVSLPTGVAELSVDYDTLGDGLPAYFSAENILAVMQTYPEYFMAGGSGGVRTITKIVQVGNKGQELTDAEKKQAAENDPYLRSLKSYARNAAVFKALKTLSFVPYTLDDELDEFALAVKNPKMTLTQEAAQTALPTLEKYVACKKIPNLHAKTFKRAYDVLSGLDEDTRVEDMPEKAKAALQSYLATGHTVSGES